jgi:hypothetical protein
VVDDVQRRWTGSSYRFELRTPGGDVFTKMDSSERIAERSQRKA